MNARCLVLCAALCVTPLLHAHGDVHDRIDALGKQIAQAPKDAALLIKRGRLYLDAGHAKDARRDLIRAQAAAPKDIDVSYYLAQAELALHHLDAAEAASRKFIDAVEYKAARSRGLLLQGDIRMAAKRPLDAANSYRAAIELSDDVRPDHYVKSAEAYLSAGETDRSLQTLNTGIDRLGPLTALNEKALTIEIDTKRYDAALGRVEKMLASNPQTPHLLYRKGVLHKLMGQAALSRQAFDAALSELNRLPLERQNTPAFQSLKATLMAEAKAAG